MPRNPDLAKLVSATATGKHVDFAGYSACRTTQNPEREAKPANGMALRLTIDHENLG
jgi:hypothetical protein